jgi:hypothetical protein
LQPPPPLKYKSPAVVPAGLLYFNLKSSSQSLIHIKFLPSLAKVKVKIEICIKIMSHLSSIFGCKCTHFFQTAKQNIVFLEKKSQGADFDIWISIGRQVDEFLHSGYLVIKNKNALFR